MFILIFVVAAYFSGHVLYPDSIRMLIDIGRFVVTSYEIDASVMTVGLLTHRIMLLLIQTTSSLFASIS